MLDEAKQMLLVHTTGVVNVGIDLADIIEVTSFAIRPGYQDVFL